MIKNKSFVRSRNDPMKVNHVHLSANTLNHKSATNIHKKKVTLSTWGHKTVNNFLSKEKTQMPLKTFKLRTTLQKKPKKELKVGDFLFSKPSAKLSLSRTSSRVFSASPSTTRIIKPQKKIKEKPKVVFYSPIKLFKRLPEHKEKKCDLSGEKLYANLLKSMNRQRKRIENSISKMQDKMMNQFLYERLRPIYMNGKKKINIEVNSLQHGLGVEYNSGDGIVPPRKFAKKFRRKSFTENVQKVEEKKENPLKIDLLTVMNNYSLRSEVQKRVRVIHKGEEAKKKKKLLEKLRKVLISAAIHLRRMSMTLQDFLDLKIENIKPYEHEKSFRLIQALKDGDSEEVRRLIELNNCLVYNFDYFHQTVLHWMAKRNQYKLIFFAIKKGAIADAIDFVGRTPLHVAAAYGNVECVMELLYDFAYPFSKDKNGNTPVDLSTNETITYILKRVLLLYFFHSMGRAKLFEENIRRGLVFLYETELGLDFSDSKFERKYKKEN